MDHTMTETELNKYSFRVYNFMRRLASAVSLDKTQPTDGAMYEGLKSIVRGELVLVPTATEMMARMPPAPGREQEVRDYLNRNTGKLIAQDKETALRILEGTTDTDLHGAPPIKD